MRLLLFAAMVLTLAPAHGAEVRERLRIDETRLSFRLTDQEGSMNLFCKHALLENTLDWEVACSENPSSSDIHRFTVHLVIHAYSNPNPPKRKYELLYWVTNHQAHPGTPGHSVGSTIWFHLKEPSDLMAIEAGQDVEDINVLRMTVRL